MSRTDTAMVYVLIAAGCAIGGMARYWSAGFLAARLGADFPWGTLAVNVLGSAFIGFFATLTGAEGRLLAPVQARRFVMVGLCGGFTTFSTFSLETLNLARDGEWIKVAANLTGSLFLCLAGVWCGYALATLLNES